LNCFYEFGVEVDTHFDSSTVFPNLFKAQRAVGSQCYLVILVDVQAECEMSVIRGIIYHLANSFVPSSWFWSSLSMKTITLESFLFRQVCNATDECLERSVRSEYRRSGVLSASKNFRPRASEWYFRNLFEGT
jgi:hypothetical protein